MVKKLAILSLVLAILLIAETVLLFDYVYLRNDYQMDTTTADSINKEVSTWYQILEDNKDTFNLNHDRIVSFCGQEVSDQIFKTYQSTYDTCFYQKSMVEGTLREAFNSGIFRYKLRRIFNPQDWFTN